MNEIDIKKRNAEYVRKYRSKLENKNKSKEYYQKNKNKILQKRKLYNLNNKEKIKQQKKKYYNKLEIKEKASLYYKEYYKNNKKKINELNKLYRNKLENKEKRKEYYKQYKKKLNQYSLNYSKNRKKIDVKFKILNNLRSRVNIAIKNNIKSSNTINLLGCSIEEAKKHLQSQFKEGMTWDNYGHKGWHIDHIKPCSSFDLTDIEQQKQCFHYTNLQPLWWYENLEKSDKI